MGAPAGGADDFDVGQLRDLEALAARAGAGDQDALVALMSRVRPLVAR